MEFIANQESSIAKLTSHSNQIILLVIVIVVIGNMQDLLSNFFRLNNEFEILMLIQYLIFALTDTIPIGQATTKATIPIMQPMHMLQLQRIKLLMKRSCHLEEGPFLHLVLLGD